MLGLRDVGTLTWAESTRGRLGARDRIELVRQGLLFQLLEIGGPVATKLRIRHPFSCDPSQISFPDSTAAQEAETLCLRMRPEMLIAHSYRTFIWATALATANGDDIDRELLYVSALLHDLGLSDSQLGPTQTRCFTLIGSGAAESLQQAAGWTSERATRAAEAITLHMNLRVPRESKEAHYLAAGAQLDATGAGKWRLERETLDAVLAAHPRVEANEQMTRLFREQHRLQRGTRAHFYWRYFSLRLRLKHARL